MFSILFVIAVFVELGHDVADELAEGLPSFVPVVDQNAIEFLVWCVGCRVYLGLVVEEGLQEFAGVQVLLDDFIAETQDLLILVLPNVYRHDTIGYCLLQVE